MRITIETRVHGERTEWHIVEHEVESFRDFLHAAAFLFAQILIAAGEEHDIAFSLGLLEALLRSSNAFLKADRRTPGPTLRVVDGRVEA
jgi:hypothetical protein